MIRYAVSGSPDRKTVCTDRGDLDWIGVAEIFDDQLAALLAMGPGR
jgi:hypothetical protein